MAFDVEHDWQGNLSIPRAKIGEKAKTRLLILLCVVWVCLGLIGHHPWKPDESQSISIIKAQSSGIGLIAPVAAGQERIQNPPLYYLSGTALAKLLSPVLPMHDAARLASGVWMAFTLLLVGMLGRELWGLGAGRQTTFIFLGSLGLIVTAHLLMPQVSALTGSAMGLYALALAKRRPFRASCLLGSGIGIAFLSTGVLYASVLAITALLLPLLFSNWRTRSYAVVLALSTLIATPWLVIWPVLLWYTSPQLFHIWYQSSIGLLGEHHHGYFLNTLVWYAWPALPLALWSIWHYRKILLSNYKFQLLISYLVISFAVIGFMAEDREIYALPLLLPLTALASGSVETLKRGAAGALNWFGLILFGMIGFLVWLGWFAMMTGWPAKLAERMQFLSSIHHPVFNWIAFTAAVTITIIWFTVVVNAKRSNRAAITDWAVGITMAWSLLMSLWLPWIDAAKSYDGIMASIGKALPTHYNCVNGWDVGDAQLALLDYYLGIHIKETKRGETGNCNVLLVQDERGRKKAKPAEDWQLIWQGHRPADRREAFRLYKRS